MNWLLHLRQIATHDHISLGGDESEFIWSGGKKVAKCNLTGPSPPTRGSSEGKRKHLTNTRIDIVLAIQRLYRDCMNLTITHESRKLEYEFRK